MFGFYGKRTLVGYLMPNLLYVYIYILFGLVLWHINYCRLFNAKPSSYMFVKYQHIGLEGKVFANGPRDMGSIPGRIIPKTLKWYLMLPCLTLINIRYVSRVKWSNPGKGAAFSPTPRCSSY